MEKIGEKNDFIFSWVDKSLKIKKINSKSKGKSLKKIYEKIIFTHGVSKSDLNQTIKKPEKIMVNNEDIYFTNLYYTSNNSIEKNNQINFIEKNEILNNNSIRLNHIKAESNSLINEKTNNFLPKNSDNNKRKKDLNIKKINIKIPNFYNTISEFNTNLKEVRLTDTNKSIIINNSNINDKEKRENSKLKIYKPKKDKILAICGKKIENYITINNVNIYRNNDNFKYPKTFKDSFAKLISKTKDNNIDKILKNLSKDIIYSRIFEKYNSSEQGIINNHNNNPNIHKPNVKSSNLSNALNSKGILFMSDKNKDSERINLRNRLRNSNITSIFDSNRINSKFRLKLYMSHI